MFLDPPYDTDFSTYDQNCFDKEDQKRLASMLKKLKQNLCWLLKIQNLSMTYIKIISIYLLLIRNTKLVSKTEMKSRFDIY